MSDQRYPIKTSAPITETLWMRYWREITDGLADHGLPAPTAEQVNRAWRALWTADEAVQIIRFGARDPIMPGLAARAMTTGRNRFSAPLSCEHSTLNHAQQGIGR